MSTCESPGFLSIFLIRRVSLTASLLHFNVRYLMNYAKSSPEDTILAVNSFVKDCQDPNPLIRALAVRTMGCIRVHKITECVALPLACVPPSGVGSLVSRTSAGAV